MGIDACIFAKNAKRYFYFDRLYNLTADFDEPTFRDLQGSGADARATRVQVLKTLAAFAQDVDDERSSRRILWLADVLRFVLAHPNDTFFVRTDHDSGDDYSWGVVKRGGYEKWMPA